MAENPGKERDSKAQEIKIGFFGTPEYAVITLKCLEAAGYQISFVVTNPDRPKGRGMKLTASPVKIWAIDHDVPVLQPEVLKNNPPLIKHLKSFGCDVFVVIAYGQIIPTEILDIPRAGSVNIHGSLLPRLRGASPIETAILNDEKKTGVTLIRMDREMDHGPIITQQEVAVEPWPPRARELGIKIVEAGSKLLVDILPDWVAGKIKEREQDHSLATFTKKIVKEDALIDLGAEPYLNFRKIQAYHEWPGAYFVAKKDGKSVKTKITSASFKNGKLTIEKVIPANGGEMDYRA